MWNKLKRFYSMRSHRLQGDQRIKFEVILMGNICRLIQQINGKITANYQTNLTSFLDIKKITGVVLRSFQREIVHEGKHL